MCVRVQCPISKSSNRKKIMKSEITSSSQDHDAELSGLYDIIVGWLRKRVGNPCIDTLAHRDRRT